MSTSNRKPRAGWLNLPKHSKKGRGAISKMVVRRMRATEKLVSAISYYKDQVAAGLAFYRFETHRRLGHQAEARVHLDEYEWLIGSRPDPGGR